MRPSLCFHWGDETLGGDYGPCMAILASLQFQGFRFLDITCYRYALGSAIILVSQSSTLQGSL